MDAGNSLVWCILFIIFIFTFVFLVELVIPISKKYELDRICRQYQITIENKGGLTEDQVTELENELEEGDFRIVGISVVKPGTVKFGELLDFIVEVEYKRSQIKALFEREDQEIQIRYKMTTLSRRVVN